jgi:hypothetical protein
MISTRMTAPLTSYIIEQYRKIITVLPLTADLQRQVGGCGGGVMIFFEGEAYPL